MSEILADQAAYTLPTFRNLDKDTNGSDQH
jgi:hypothetical protein